MRKYYVFLNKEGTSILSLNGKIPLDKGHFSAYFLKWSSSEKNALFPFHNFTS